MFHCSERFPLPFGVLDGLHYFIVALPGPSILLFYRVYINLVISALKHRLWELVKNAH